MESIDNVLPTPTRLWGSFDERETYLSECECGCGKVHVRYVGSNRICVPQTLLVWAFILLGEQVPGKYVLPQEFGATGSFMGRETRLERYTEIGDDYGNPVIRYTDNGKVCIEQSYHILGANIPPYLVEELPNWLQYFLMAESLIAQYQGKEVVFDVSVGIPDHEDPLSREQKAQLARMVKISQGAMLSGLLVADSRI